MLQQSSLLNNMGFSSKSVFQCHQYSINIAELISPIYHLVVELCEHNDRAVKFHQWAHNLFDVKKVIGVSTLPESNTEDSFCMDVASYLEDELYLSVDELADSRITMLYRNEGKIFVNQADGCNCREILISWIEKFNPIKYLFESLIIDEAIKNLENKLYPFINKTYYSKAVTISSGIKLNSTIIPYEWVKLDECEEKVIDKEALWFGSPWKDKVDYEMQLPKEIIRNNESIGLVLGGFIIPFINIDDIINKDYFSQYFWEMLLHVYSKHKHIKKINRDLTPFVDACKDSDFCKILSFLNHNLYIRKGDVEIPQKYKDFFEEVYKIQKLKHLDTFNFYTNIPNENNGQTLLGVYALEKKSSNYNLLHWINTHNDSSHKYSTVERDDEMKSDSVYALRPAYSYYLVSRYFEEMFNSILEELGCKYISNIELSKNGSNDIFIEIDSIVQKTDGTLVYFENKTTLTKYNIEETISKIEQFQSLISNSYPYAKFEYVIIAPYCDQTVEANYLYFIKNNGGIVEDREGSRQKLYSFTIPLARFSQISLKCIVEPEYEKMKTLINSIIR